MNEKLTDSLSKFSGTDYHWSPPVFFDLKSDNDLQGLTRLLDSHSVQRVHDEIKIALAELYDIKNPASKDTKTKTDINAFVEERTGGNLEAYGTWVFFPWSGSLVHFPPKDDLRALRTIRNRNLVTAEEQLKLYEATLLIAGLSVGSNVAEMLVSQGIGGKLILIDMDIIEPSNLNRIKTIYSEVGIHKVDMLAKRISEIDPYIEQIHVREGLNENNLVSLVNEFNPDILIDEIDHLGMKLKIRELAARENKPVIMATDNGDNAILDVERYDTHKDQKPFDGRIPDEIIQKIHEGSLTRSETGILIGKYFVGTEHIPLRMFESLIEVGRTIPSWPQLASAATMSGVLCAYAAKKIILGLPLSNGRYLFDIDQALDPTVNSTEYKKKTNAFIERFFS